MSGVTFSFHSEENSFFRLREKIPLIFFFEVKAEVKFLGYATCHRLSSGHDCLRQVTFCFVHFKGQLMRLVAVFKDLMAVTGKLACV